MKTRLKIGVAIYWDVQNVRISPEQIPQLSRWFNQNGKLLINNAYAYWRNENKLFEQSIFKAGINAINVPSREKNAVDNLIIKHCKEDILSNREIRLVILITGDKDYLPLVKDLQELGIKVMLLFHVATQSKKLMAGVDQVYDIDKLLNSINVDKAITEAKQNSSMMISYEEAKQCLIKSIQRIQTEGKKATFSLIGKLIKEHLQLYGYQKTSSIAKPTGGKFSKFSQFVESVIQEGIIKNNNGNLSLVKT